MGAVVRAAAVLGALCACSGSPFSYVSPDLERLRDVQSSTDMGAPDAQGLDHDSSQEDGAVSPRWDAADEPDAPDAASDRSNASDASSSTPDVLGDALARADALPMDAAGDVSGETVAPDSPACTPVASSVESCGQSAVGLSSPGQFCATTYNGADRIAPMPPACQCAGQVTCACLLAHLDPCPGQTSTCMPSDPYVHVICK
jgi:hypothetical protein